MSFTDKYSDIEKCGCGQASVKFQPVLGEMDSYWTTLVNCQSRKVGYKLTYECSACGEVFTTADPTMIASESVTDSYKEGRYRSPDPNQRDIMDLIREVEG